MKLEPYDKHTEPYVTIALSIAQELKEHPELWIQNKYRTENGEACLVGHILNRTLGDYVAYGITYRAIQSKLSDPVMALSYWNDVKGRTVEEVIELCEKVASL